MKAAHIKDSIHFKSTKLRKPENLNTGDHAYLAHLPYSITCGYIVTGKDELNYYLDGRPMSANHNALYTNKNEAIDEMIRQLLELKDENN